MAASGVPSSEADANSTRHAAYNIGESARVHQNRGVVSTGCAGSPRAFYTSEEGSRKGTRSSDACGAASDARAGSRRQATTWSSPSRTNRSLSCAAGTESFEPLQRVPASRHSPVHGGDGPVRRRHPVSVPRMDLHAIEGDLIGAPHMHGVDGFNRDYYPLHTAAVAESNGFVFVNVATSTTPFAP